MAIYPLTQYLIDLTKADRKTLQDMPIDKTAQARGIRPDWVKSYRDRELSTR